MKYFQYLNNILINARGRDRLDVYFAARIQSFAILMHFGPPSGAYWAHIGPLVRPTQSFLPIPVDFLVFRNALGTILEGPGRVRGGFWRLPTYSFQPFFARRTDIDRTMCILEKPSKTSTGAIKIKVRAFRHHRKKTCERRLQRLRRTLFRGWVRDVLTERSQMRSGCVLDLAKLVFGGGWGSPGPSWASLGHLLGALGRFLGASWALLGVSCPVSGASWVHLRSPGRR